MLGPHRLRAVASAPARPEAEEFTSGTLGTGVLEIEAPLYFAPLPRTTVFSKLYDVEAATVVSHGLLWATVDAVGPLLPAEVATKTPAAAAPRKAYSTASTTVLVAPEIE